MRQNKFPVPVSTWASVYGQKRIVSQRQSPKKYTMQATSIVVLCTCPDQETADYIAETLVSEQLAACVNIVSGLTSIYRWAGQVQRDAEFLLLIKSRAEIYVALEKRICELHPYEVPEIIALPIEKGLLDYLTWLAKNTGYTQ